MSQAIDLSTRALSQTGAQVQKLLAELPKTIDTQIAEIQANANTLQDQENLIAANKASIETQVREAGAEIRLQVKEDKESVLTDLLGEFGLTGVKPDVIRELNSRAVAAEQALEQAEWAAVNGAVKAAEAKAQSHLDRVVADNRVAIAEYTAQAKSDATTIELLKGQVATLEATITAMREAEIAKAEAAAKAAGVVVNAGK